MSKYTTELRYICEMKSGFSMDEIPDKSPEEIIQAARPVIFDFDFPIYDETLRIPLELKILRHYYTREIGVETYGLWKWRLNSKLNEIMPMYNKLYEAEFKLASASGIYNVDITINRDSFSQNESHSEEQNENESKDAFSDTPQNGLKNVEDLAYLTDYRNIKNDGSGSADTRGNANGHEDSREFGYRGNKTMNELLNDFKNNIINIDQLIIMELNDLFFLLY